MVRPYLLGIDSDDPQPEMTWAEGRPFLLYLRVGDRVNDHGEELFYTWAVPTDNDLTGRYRKCVGNDGTFSELQVALSGRIERCAGDVWDQVFNLVREFAWHEDD